MPFASVPEILKELRRGGTALLLDHREPDSLGDIICAAEKVSAKTLNFMASEARGLIRLSLPAKLCEDLQLEIQARNPDFPLQKAFTVSIDARGLLHPGISVKSRAKTILTAIDTECKASDLVRPGHVLPLRARTGGVLIRAGKTEGSMDLARLAGMCPAGVMCEVLDTKGEQMRLNQLKRFSSKHNLKMCTIADIIEFRLSHEEIIERLEDVEMPTDYGNFRLIAFRSMQDPEPHIALCKGGVGDLDRFGRVIPRPEPVLVRVQPECLPGCVFGTQFCTCGKSLAKAQERIEEEGKGAIVLLRRYPARVEEMVHPHATSSRSPAVPADRRDFGLGSQILHSLGLNQLRVLTNSRHKIFGIEGFGLSVVERLSLR
ncbi:MAG: 3,4-dihydroxy-2-butanone-4-phosphate synthase [Planctomycetota bacterium]|nr:3,4-dihydroxy-2-butanone-4-phosphate synthase [Planctomycetota bacterium]